VSVRFRVFGGLLVAAAALSGCSSVGKMFGSSSDTAGVGSGAQASASPAPVDFDCPPVEIRSGASTLTVSADKPGESGASDLRYQGSIVRTARECSLNSGIVGLKVGIEGRIVIGPAGGPGQIDVPMRIAVVEEGPNPKTIATKLYRTTVLVPPDQGNSNFSYVAEDLSFPMPRAADIDKYVIYLGFDQQAETKPKLAPRKPAPKRARVQG
jgi:hypothetical protein